MYEISAIDAAVPAFVLFVVQILKKFKPFQNGKAKELLPVIAGLIGVPTIIVYQLVFGVFINEVEAIGQLVIYGFGLGLTACGTFSFAKGLFMGKPKN